MGDEAAGHSIVIQLSVIRSKHEGLFVKRPLLNTSLFASKNRECSVSPEFVGFSRLPEAHALHHKILDSLRLWEVSSASAAVDDIVGQLKKEVSLPILEAASKTLGASLKDLPEKQRMAVGEAVDVACAWLSRNAAVMKTESKIVVSFFRTAAVGEDQRQWQMIVEQAQLLSEAFLKCRSVLDQGSVAASELKPEVATLAQVLRGCEEKLRMARCKNQERQEKLQAFMKEVRSGVEDARSVLQEGAHKLMGLYVQQLSAKTVT